MRVGLPRVLESRKAVEKPLSEGKLDVVRQQFETLNRHGVEAASVYWHPDIEWRAVEGAIDDIGVFSGARCDAPLLLRLDRDAR
jgi:hypothetical protein